jgi:serine/threonine-protein kinase
MKKNYTISIAAATFWKIVVPAAVVVMVVGALGGIIVVDRFVMPNIVGVSNRGVVKVPNIVDMPRDEARQKLYAVGLRLHTADRRYSMTTPDDVIISQQPESGASVKKGRHIAAVISRGPEVDTIPAVRKMPEHLAKKAMREKGFHEIEMRRVFDDKVEKDRIVRSAPGGGTVTSREVEVTLYLSDGPRPTHAVAPNVIGDMLSEAKEKIRESGLKVGAVEYKAASVAAPGSIISQSVSPGASVPFESAVTLVVAAH